MKTKNKKKFSTEKKSEEDNLGGETVEQIKSAKDSGADKILRNFIDNEAPPKWYEKYVDDPTLGSDIDEDTTTSLRFEAQKVFDDEVKFYHSKMQKANKSSDQGWIRTVLQKGTAGDKMAALIVSVQNSPIHNLNALNSLISMVKVARKRLCTEVMSSLSELFVGDLLKPDLKLRPFEGQPLSRLDELSGNNAMSRRLRLAAWMFEERLKTAYTQYISAVDLVAKDTVEANREKAISVMQYLLESHPEQEDVLLKNIVNKLGDPSMKVVSKVIYCLTQLLRAHPNMKRIVMNEVEKLLFRPNISVRTQYYGVCFLSQFVFKNNDTELARNVINIYFSFFKASIKWGEVDTRLMGALLMGVKRAFPFAKPDPGEGMGDLKAHIETLYKLVHISTFNIALHTLSLLQQVSAITEDRFYSALYKKLLDARLGQSTHHALLINLLYKALQKDENISRVKALIKRLFQICLYLPVPLVCGLLYMVSQLMKRKRSLTAFQTEAKILPSFLTEKVDEDDDGEEKYADVIEIKDEKPDEEETPVAELDGTVVEIKQEKDDDKEDVKPAIERCSRSWYHCDVGPKSSRPNLIGTYDPNTRNPAFAGAENTAYFELLALANHFHPTVSLYASKILNNEIIVYSGDPLVDFTLIRFLERFVFKNPKKTNETAGKGPDPKLAMRKYYAPTGAKAMLVTSKVYLKQEESSIPVDEVFLYRYLKERYGEEGLSRKKRDDDNDSVASEEFEEMLNNMMSKSKKKKKDLDFMEDVGDSLKQSKKKGKGDDEESDGEDSEEEDGSDEDEDMMDEEENEDMEEMSDMDGDDEIMDFSSDEEGINKDVDVDEFYNEEESGKKKKKLKDKGIKKKKPNLNDIKSLFAPAEEFAEILEETGATQQKLGMAHTFVNKENAADKQLNWEAKRDRWIKGVGEHKSSNRKRKWGPPGKKFGKKDGAKFKKQRKT